MKDRLLRVLMVDDSEDDVQLIIRELKKGGYDPLYERVETGVAMQKALQEKQWDIVLCDYKMPKFNALSAITVFKKENIDIPLIIVSGAIGEETAVECMRLGAQDYIVKGNFFRLCPAIARELKDAEVRSKKKQVESERKAALEALHQNIIERASRKRRNFNRHLTVSRRLLARPSKSWCLPWSPEIPIHTVTSSGLQIWHVPSPRIWD